MSGICSTPRRMYEAMPSTHSATMTIVANTGFAIETRVIHMMVPQPAQGRSQAGERPFGPRAGCLERSELGVVITARRPPGHLARRRDRLGARDDDRLLPFAQVVETGRDDLRRRRDAGDDLDQALGLVAAAGGHRAARQRAIGDHPDLILPRAPDDRERRQREAGRRVGDHDAGQGVLSGAQRLVGIAIATVTPIERVSGSAAGAMRTSLPCTGVSTPSTRTDTACPAPGERPRGCPPYRQLQLGGRRSTGSAARC